MQVFALIALVPALVAAHPGYGAPAYGAPAYGAPAYPAYEAPKHNCSVLDVVEAAEVCTPAFTTVCEPVVLSRKNVVDKQQCYTVTRTVCTESVEEIDNEVCTYSYQPKTEATTAKTVEVTFKKECTHQMVTVCQPAPAPAYGAGYGAPAYGASYGHNYCKEVAQETCFNTPVVTPVLPPVEVVYPEPIKTCVNKPIALPKITCEDLSAEKCITVPAIEEVTETLEVCKTALGAPACQAVELTLPKQVCVELVYGYAADEAPAPAYPAPAPYAPAPYAPAPYAPAPYSG